LVAGKADEGRRKWVDCERRMQQMDMADPVEVIVTLQGYQAKLAGQVTSHTILS
jgi:hypothetical protein